MVKMDKVSKLMAWLYAVLFSINALSTSIVAALLNSEWSELSPTTKFLTVVLITANWSGTMLAFLSKTMARLEKGESPIDPNGVVESTTKQTVIPNPK